jgi:hypothetical protein
MPEKVISATESGSLQVIHNLNLAMSAINFLPVLADI